MNFAYLQAQTFGDVALEAELLHLFREQARRLIPSLPKREEADQGDAAHLLKGSARAVGAEATAGAVELYEVSAPDLRGEGSACFAALLAAFADDEAAIADHLASLG